MIIDPKDMMHILLKSEKEKVFELAYRFHFTVAQMILDFSLFALKNTPHLNRSEIVLTGGVFQNKLLYKLTTELLRSRGFSPLTSELFSPGDGQISMGQALIVRDRINSNA
jgi:hydrogenase maturation protein HypF